jgi:hypothetical protein
VVALLCLIAGLLCGVVSRILLTTAAFRISLWWGVGVFLPFGPLFFRLSYPVEAANSRIFRLATLACIFFFVAFGGIKPGFYPHKMSGRHQPVTRSPPGYASERPVPITPMAISTPMVRLTPSLNERYAANARQLEQLRVWGEQLRLRKKDLRPDDAEGNRVYAIDFSMYNDALARATAERNSLSVER